MPEYTICTDIQILRTVSKPITDGPPRLKQGEWYVSGKFSSQTHKPLKGKVIRKTESTIIINKAQIVATTEYATISNLPIPSKVIVGGNGANFNDEVTDGIFEFSIDTAGDYKIICSSLTDLDINFQIKVIASQIIIKEEA